MSEGRYYLVTWRIPLKAHPGRYGKIHTKRFSEEGTAEVFARSKRSQGAQAQVQMFAVFKRRTGSH